MKPQLLDLFSGIGGFSLGLERAGFETVAFCEVSEPCRHLLAHHWPKVPCYDDIRTLTAERLAADGIAVDAICGGFPCQDISEAGNGAGIDGARSGLWREYARLICELRPRVVLVENVSALLSRGLGRVLGDLAALGYDAQWDCISASAIGAPHERDRLWIVANRHQSRWDRASFNSVLGMELRRKSYRKTSPDWRQRNVVSWLKSDGAASLWEEPDAPPGRVNDGVSRGLDSEAIGALGNAVVPQIPEILGRAVLAALA